MNCINPLSFMLKVRIGLAFLFCFFLINSRSQSKSTAFCTLIVNSQIANLKGKPAVLQIHRFQPDSATNYRVVKSFPVSKDLFSTSFKASQPFTCFVQLIIDDTIYARSSPFIVSNEPINLEVDKSDEIKVKSKQNDFLIENRFLFLSMPAAVVNQQGFSVKLIKRSYQISIPENRILELKIKEHERNIIKQVAANNRYYFTLQSLEQNKDLLSLQTLDTCYAILYKTYKGLPDLKKIEDYITQSKKLIPGKQILSFNVVDSNNLSLRSDSVYKTHRFTLLDFWASWCGPCRVEMEKLKHIYDSTDKSQFQIVSISIDGNKNSWLTAMKQDKVTWKSYIDNKGWQGDVVKTFALTSIPQNILVDETGKIITTNIWGTDLRNFLSKEKIYQK